LNQSKLIFGNLAQPKNLYFVKATIVDEVCVGDIVFCINNEMFLTTRGICKLSTTLLQELRL
jgi:hypothetical protein